MLPVLWRCRPLRLLQEDRSSALFTDVTAGADSGYRFRRQCICTVAVGYWGRDYQESAGQSDPLRLLCQTVTHRIPAKWYPNQSQSGILPIRDRIERNTQPRQIRVPFRRYRPVMPERLPLCTPFPFDFEFFVVAIPLNVPGSPVHR